MKIRSIAIIMLLFAVIMLLPACDADKSNVNDNPNVLPGKGEGSSMPVKPEDDAAGNKITAIGVANPYSEISMAQANAGFGILISLPEEASEVHCFDIETGGQTHMLQIQFLYGNVQYILRAKQAGKLTNISAVYAKWDSEEDCVVSGCAGKINMASNGAGVVMWYDPSVGTTFALSAQDSAVSEDICELAGMIYTAGDGGQVPQDEVKEENEDDDKNVIPPPPASEPASVKIYYPANDGVSFTSSGFTTGNLNEEYLIKRLAEMGVLTGNVTVNWMNAMTIDEKGNCELALSLSDGFQTQLTASDEKSEYMLVGSIVNTFLDAYDASRIWLYVGNDVPDSKNYDYNRALTAYGSYKAAEIETKEESEEKKEEESNSAPPDPDMTLAEKICELAKSKVGAEYEYGAAGPDTFDNSGFVYWCFRENGVSIARRTTDMYKNGTEVGEDDLQPGDVVFFTYEEDRSPSYVGIYLGGGKFIAENKSGNPVKIMDMTTQYFKEIYIGARRYA